MAPGRLRKEGLLDVGAPFARGDQDHIEACRAVGQFRMLAQKHLGGGGNARLLARQNRPGGLFVRFPPFNFHEGQMIATLCHKIDFAALGFVAMSEDPVILGFKETSGRALGSNARLVRGSGA